MTARACSSSLGSNTYTGPTTVSGGTLLVGSGGTGAAINTTSSIALSASTALVFNDTDAVTMPNPITGAGKVLVAAGFINLASTNSYTGGTTVGSSAASEDSASAAPPARWPQLHAHGQPRWHFVPQRL